MSSCVYPVGRLRPAAQQAVLRERRALQSSEEFPCELTKALNDDVAFKYLRGSRSVGSWSRMGSWMEKFFAFAREVCTQSGQHRTQEQCVASTTMCRHFIAMVANESKGSTRPRSARAALSKFRLKRGWTHLNDDQAISAIVQGAEAECPRTKRQSAGFSRRVVNYVVGNWGVSRLWWERQVATVMALGFVSLMRLGEICSIQRSGIRVVYADGSEADLQKLSRLPTAQEIKGLLFHLPWRKNHVAQDCWVPVSCKVVLRLVLRQVRSLRDNRSPNTALFPARVYRGRKESTMNPTNWMGERPWVRSMQDALMKCVPFMSTRWAKLYTGHAMRVGGSNYMRKIGMSSDIHRRMGGWMSLTSAQGYMALSPAEQFRYTVSLAKTRSRRSAMTPAAARGALEVLPTLS